jgi:GPH family glycoside/pentoside/hexuronide:cation symporter
MSNISPSDPSVPPSQAKREKLSLGTKLAYGAGDLGPAITANIGVFFALFFFTNVAGLGAGLAGSILMIGKIWDAINDPMVGVLSDRTKHPSGRRLPWMLYGAIPFGITFFLQWIVPHFSNDKTANSWSLFWYYVIIAIVFNTFYTVVNLPYTALTPELTQDYNERTSLNSFRFSFSIGGSILSLILAQLIFAQLKIPVTQQYLVLAGVCTVLSVLPLFWCVWGVRSRVLASEARRLETEEPEHIPIPQQLQIAFSNQPFLYVVGIYLCSWLGVQVTASILPYFVVNWMNLPAAEFPLVAIAVQGTALVMLFVWSAVSARVGKKVVYFMGMIVWIIAQAGLFFLQPSQVGLMYFLAVLAGVGVSTAYLCSLVNDPRRDRTRRTENRSASGRHLLWFHGATAKSWFGGWIVFSRTGFGMVWFRGNSSGTTSTRSTCLCTLSYPYCDRSATHTCLNFRVDSCLLLSHHPRGSCRNSLKAQRTQLSWRN